MNFIISNNKNGSPFCILNKIQVMESFFEFGENVIGLVVNEKIDADKIEEIQEIIDQKMKMNSERVSIYLEDKNKDGISIRALLKHIAYHLDQPEALQKVAVVTDSKWFEIVMEMKDLFTKSELLTFSTEQRIEAMNWIVE